MSVIRMYEIVVIDEIQGTLFLVWNKICLSDDEVEKRKENYDQSRRETGTAVVKRDEVKQYESRLKGKGEI